MEVEETKLETPKKFLFPFQPYSIQNEFMEHLYEAIEGKKLGIFESPTGTGKSMSLICGSLKWLYDAQERLKTDVESNIQKLNCEIRNADLGKNWLDGHASLAKSRKKKDSLNVFRSKIIDMENRINELHVKASKINDKSNKLNKNFSTHEKGKSHNNKENNFNHCENTEIDDHDLLLDDLPSINDEYKPHCDSTDSETEADGLADKYFGIKIFICSRTHSQLAQLINEVKRSPFKELNIRVITLASRQNYCINENVLNLKNLSLINEKCQELHKNKNGKATKTSKEGEPLKKRKTSMGCPYYNSKSIENLKLKSLTEILDVEETVHYGERLQGCPYYASRQAINEAQLIVLPYNIILHKATRLACGLNLKGSVIIIDEAHNLLDAIDNIHSCTITGFDLIACYSQLTRYRDKFSDRFSPVNLLHLNQIIFVVGKFLKKIGGNCGTRSTAVPEEKKVGVSLETVADFVLSTEVDTINFFKILEFASKSNLVNKLRGFTDRYSPSVAIHEKKEEKGISAFLKKISTKEKSEVKDQEKEEEEEESFLKGNPMLSIIGFVQSLTNHYLDSRIVCNISKTVGTSSLKYLLLNPAAHFSDLVKDARSIILAGGTMQPVSEFTHRLFNLAGGTPERISVFTCGHIIPEENILPIAVSTGPTGRIFDFSFQQRSNTDVLDELGRLLVNVCNVVPAGIVCFFSSYDYANVAFRHFEESKILEKLRTRKEVMREPKNSNLLDQVLKEYGAAASKRGALLFSVVGGKLSEGLNFNDDLGRCVIVVGLPYPNITSPELKEKMNYLNETVGSGAGKTYYENLCMKAVNQSIGRSIRHKNDYASVLLIDQRFARPKCYRALPKWIEKGLHREEKFGSVIKLLAKFFASKRQ